MVPDFVLIKRMMEFNSPLDYNFSTAKKIKKVIFFTLKGSLKKSAKRPLIDFLQQNIKLVNTYLVSFLMGLIIRMTFRKD